MSTADEIRVGAERYYIRLRSEILVARGEAVRDFIAGAEWQASRKDSEVAALTAQLQAAQAAIKAHNDGLISDCYDIDADLSSLAEHDKQVAAKALKDAAIQYPFLSASAGFTMDWLSARAASIEQTEADRG